MNNGKVIACVEHEPCSVLLNLLAWPGMPSDVKAGRLVISMLNAWAPASLGPVLQIRIQRTDHFLSTHIAQRRSECCLCGLPTASVTPNWSAFLIVEVLSGVVEISTSSVSSCWVQVRRQVRPFTTVK